MENDEKRYCFEKNNNWHNVVFNRSLFKDALCGNKLDVYYI